MHFISGKATSDQDTHGSFGSTVGTPEQRSCRFCLVPRTEAMKTKPTNQMGVHGHHVV